MLYDCKLRKISDRWCIKWLGLNKIHVVLPKNNHCAHSATSIIIRNVIQRAYVRADAIAQWILRSRVRIHAFTVKICTIFVTELRKDENKHKRGAWITYLVAKKFQIKFSAQKKGTLHNPNLIEQGKEWSKDNQKGEIWHFPRRPLVGGSFLRKRFGSVLFLWPRVSVAG